MPNSVNITPLTANNTINDMRLKVNEIALVFSGYVSNTNLYVFSNTEIQGYLTVLDDIIVANNSINQHLANNYAHGVTVENISFNANTGIFTLNYNNLSTSFIDISSQDHVTFNHIDSNTISASGNTNILGIVTANSDVYVTGNTEITGNLLVNSDVNVAGNTFLNNITISGTSEFDTDLHVTGSAIIDLNLEVDGGNITSTSNNFNLLSSPQTLNVGAGSQTVTIGSLTGNTAIRNDLRVAGDVYITGQELNSTTSIFNLLNNTANTINFGGEANEIIIGSTSGTVAIRHDETVAGNLSVTGNTEITGTLLVNSGNFDSNSTSVNYLQTPASVTLAANASSITIGSTSGTTTIRNNEDILGSLTVSGLSAFTSNVSFNSGNILSNASVVNLFPNSDSVVISSTSGTTRIRNNTQIDKDLVVVGDFTVSGNTTIINTTTLEVEDKNIEIGKVSDPSDTTANGGGITLKGLTDKTILWDSSNANWTSSENWNIVSGKVYKIGNDSVLSATTLGSSVVFSSLTTLGTIATGHWSADTIEVSKGGTNLTTYTKGDIIFASANDVLAKLPIGLENQLLQVTSDGVVRWVSNLDGGDY